MPIIFLFLFITLLAITFGNVQSTEERTNPNYREAANNTDLRGTWPRRPSNLCTVTLGFALKASNTILIFFLVVSEHPRL